MADQLRPEVGEADLTHTSQLILAIAPVIEWPFSQRGRLQRMAALNNVDRLQWVAKCRSPQRVAVARPFVWLIAAEWPLLGVQRSVVWRTRNGRLRPRL